MPKDIFRAQVPPKIITQSHTGTTKTKNVNDHGRSKPNNTDQKERSCCTTQPQLQKSLIDAISINFPTKGCSVRKEQIFQGLEAWLLKFYIRKIRSKADSRYYRDGVLLQSNDGASSFCGAIKWDDATVRLEMKGQGCNYINVSTTGWTQLYDFSYEHGGVITEIHIAVDDMTGKFNNRDTKKAYWRKRYKSKKGKNPTIKSIGPGQRGAKNEGQTIYIGSYNSDKQMCIYEKGKEQRLPESDPNHFLWTRHELRLRAGKITIDLGVLLDPDSFFAGAYLANQRILPDVKPRSIKRETLTTLSSNFIRTVKHAKYQYGRSVHTLSAGAPDNDAVIDLLGRPGKPKNLSPPAYLDEKETLQHIFSQAKAAVEAEETYSRKLK